MEKSLRNCFLEEDFFRTFFFDAKYIILHPGGSKRQTDAMVSSKMSF